MFGSQKQNSPFSLLDRIRDGKKEIDSKIEINQNEIKKIEEKQNIELQKLRDQEENMRSKMNMNQDQMRLESELSQLRQRKEEAISTKENYKQKIRQYEQNIAQQQLEDIDNNAEAELAMYKSIAPIKILSSNNSTIKGIIAFGTPETTSFFEYRSNNNISASNDLWDRISKLYELANKEEE